MSVTYEKTAPDQGDQARNNDPVLQLAHARDQLLMLWSDAQRQAGKIVGAVPPEAGNGPDPGKTQRYTEAHQRSVDLLDRLLEIEAQLYDTTATTSAGLMFQALLLRDAVFPSDHEGRRLLDNIISGIARLCNLGSETHLFTFRTTINSRLRASPALINSAIGGDTRKEHTKT